MESVLLLGMTMTQLFGIAEPGKSSDTIAYLGTFSDEAQCLAACASHQPRCWTYTWYSTNYTSNTYDCPPPFCPPATLIVGQCFGITSPRWSPTPTPAQINSAILEWPCRTNDDCSLNGVCSHGSCNCRPQWNGLRCETLVLRPATRGAGYRGVDGGANTSSWGGAVLRSDDGRYHMWVSEITEHCGIGTWAQNSRIIRAEAKDLASPFVRKQVVWGVFAHEPMVQRAPSGEYVMWFVSDRQESAHGQCKCCREASKCDGSTGPGDCPTGQRAGSASPTYMSFAKAPEGPWSAPQKIFPHYIGSDMNFAPLILPNGSLVALWRKWICSGTNCDGTGRLGSRVFIARASDWRNISTYVRESNEVVSTDLGNAGTEDPFLYLDEDGNYHALFHHMYGEDSAHHWWLNTCGGHAFSRDGQTWQYGGVAWGNAEHPQENTVPFTSGYNVPLTRRERPHLVFDAKGAPALLTHHLGTVRYRKACVGRWRQWRCCLHNGAAHTAWIKVSQLQKSFLRVGALRRVNDCNGSCKVNVGLSTTDPCARCYGYTPNGPLG